MEEILSSIRRVMAREDAESGKVAAPKAVGSKAVGNGADANGAAHGDTHGDAPFAAEQAAGETGTSEEGAAEEEVLELTDTSPEQAGATGASLLATDRVAASRQSLTQLAEAVKPGPRPDLAIGTVSLDEMVQDMVRPMLKEWLDAHLPDIVERMVSREISRITDRNY